MRRRYQTAELHWRIGSALARVDRGEIDRLMIRMPPRHGKSTIASLAFPSWFLGRNPEKRIIAASYGDHLARGFGRGARNLIGLPTYQQLFPDINVSRGSSAADAWDIEGHDGGYLATSVGGAITGMGAHVLLIDDPVKSREEAESQVLRDKTWNWYTNDAYTRLEDGGAVVVIMTPWHQDDLSGRLLAEQENGGDRWEVLDLPALDANGNALWPEKYNVEALGRIRRAIGEYGFSALYQQKPTPAGGAVFKREWMDRRWTVDDLYRLEQSPRWVVVQSSDLGGKQGVGHDPSAIATWATDGISYYLIDYWSSQAEYADVKTVFAKKWLDMRPRMLYVEDATWAQPLISDLRRDTAINVAAIPPQGSKWVRADAVAPIFESGRVVLPTRAPWLSSWVNDHLAFPNGVHDEAVDTTSLALSQLANYKAPMPPGGHRMFTDVRFG